MSKRTWNNQFTINEERILTVPQELLRHPWQDHSGCNEVCPRFVNPEIRLSIWVDYDRQVDREMDNMSKFTVVRIVDNEDTLDERDLFAADNWSAVLQFIRTYEIGLRVTRAELELEKALSVIELAEKTEFVRKSSQYIAAALDEIKIITETPLDMKLPEHC